MAVAPRPFQQVRDRWLAVVLVGVLSVVVWLLAREQISVAVRLVAHALVAVAGYETYDLRPDVLTIIVGPAPDGVLVKGTTLERWHVNLIALPILAVAFGPAPWLRRLWLCIAGLALVLAADAVAAIAFVAAQGWGATGEPTIGAGLDPEQRHTVRVMAMQGVAVYAVKLIPIAVWVGLYWGFVAGETRRD